MVGYCPQFDALIDQLTGREHLVMFARLKGIPEKEIRQIVINVLTAVGVMEYADKQVKNYRYRFELYVITYKFGLSSNVQIFTVEETNEN